MQTGDNWLWLGGWAIDPAAAERWATGRFPQARHRWVFPGRGWRAEMEEEAPALVCGYSLGALLLIQALAEGWRCEGRLCLLAPFGAFCKEAGRGGRVSVTQVKFLRRWLKRDAAGAVVDFRARAGLNLPVCHMDTDNLDWGLEVLICMCVELLPDLSGVLLVAGAEDALLDAAVLAGEFDGLRVLPGAGHCVTELAEVLDEAAV